MCDICSSVFADEKGGGKAVEMNPLKVMVRLTLAVALLGIPAACHGVSLSGIVLYSAYDSGDPNGAQTYDGQLQAQLWRTRLGGEWYGLGVWNGLPPQSWAAPPLNAPDFSVDIPLKDGENDFTLLGEPGPATRVDDYTHYAINLYFDGDLDHPGISVLFPGDALPPGSPTTPNRAAHIYSLSLNEVQSPPRETYDNGVVSVSVIAASFLPPEVFGVDVDLVSAQQLAPSGQGDFIGVLKLRVEPSSSRAVTSEGCQVAPRTGTPTLSRASVCVAALCLLIRRWRTAQQARPSARPK
jgi:hypothetical protein